MSDKSEKKKKKFYAVARGRKTGIFSSWFGPGNAEAQIKGFEGARFKGFFTIEEARQWLEQMETTGPSGRAASRKSGGAEKTPAPAETGAVKDGEVVVYTDGGCSCNPGPGGYGAVILTGKTRKELSGGFRLTTNNRMELMACIQGLRALKAGAGVTLYSDSRYVVNGITKGWAKKWRSNGWMRTKTEAAENYDLWEQLLELCDSRSVAFIWVKGHAGNEENERCDHLATGWASKKNLPRDAAYESGKTKIA